MDGVGPAIGFGLFSSFFATAGMTVSGIGLTIIFKSDNIGQCVTGIFPMLFGLPFMAVPVILSFSIGNWGIAITGYTLAFTYIGCVVLRRTTNVCDARNPCQIGGGNRTTTHQPQSHRIQPPVAAIHASPISQNNINHNNNNYSNVNAHMRSPMENHYNQYNPRVQNVPTKVINNNKSEEQIEGLQDTMPPPLSYNELPPYYANQAPPPYYAEEAPPPYNPQ